MFEILPRDWNLKSIFTQKWVSVDKNWGGGSTPTIPTPDALLGDINFDDRSCDATNKNTAIADKLARYYCK